ncbi:hypothetical protein ONZ43_g6355 [Nemania bipapillata]|uniref:Uncharacterized protein n=1 Tax=Nemania bipapillata TaxID=110536 RepID=A0ACC2I137_9PEZI|nr:hypothetical protein ONZ43_g6355 [Nemania bipapillata]
MPGNEWKKASRKWRTTLEEAVEKPLKFAFQRIANGNAIKSFVADFHDEKGGNLTPEDYRALKWTAFTLYVGGSDTGVSTMTAFFLAMTLFPTVQSKAREEIDRVIGTGRLPTFSDRESLPYVNAVVTEAWRWHPALPTGVAHTTMTEDFVDGYYIPKGAIVTPNVWWFMHDPAVYPDPSVFNPSRFLGSNPAPDPTKHVFGYGRRQCSGRYFADSLVWIHIAQCLAVFDISKALDEDGREIEPTVQFLPGLISRTEEFKATVKPRSHQHEALIRQLQEQNPWDKSNADELQEIVI